MAFMNYASLTARMMRAVCILGTLSLAAALSTTANAQSASPPAAQTLAPVAGNSTNAAPKTVIKPDVKPLWNELTPAQQQALAPLASEWNKLDSNHKTKWLAISSKYATLSPEMQKRMQENIRDWAKLTPEQHRIARESYARAKKLNTEQRAAQWQQYQQLPEEQKQKLAADAATKKHVANLPGPQSKIKTVEPLKSTKSAANTHNAVLPANNAAANPNLTRPAASPAAAPVAATTPAVASPAASASGQTPLATTPTVSK